MKYNPQKPCHCHARPWSAASALTLALALTLAISQVHAQATAKQMPASAAPTLVPAQASASHETSESINAIPFQVLPDREAVLSSLMMTRVESVTVKLGDTVQKGAILVVFDCKELQARRASSMAEQVGAQDTHMSKLRLQGLGAAGELEVALAAAAVDRALSNVSQIDAQIINCKLVAPFTGSISRLRVKEQEVVAPNQAVLDIVDTKNLKLQLFIPASLTNRVSTGSLLSVQVNDEDKPRRARVSRINPRIDGASQVLEIEAVLVEAVAGLKPGMLGNARLMASREPRPRTPKLDEQVVVSPKK